MTSTKTYNFDNASEYNFDSEKVKIEGGKARLKLVPHPNQIFDETFTSSVGFTYDSTLVEFTGTQLQQKDQLDGATFAAHYTSTIDGTTGNGNITGTAQNGAVIADSRLNLKGGSLNTSPYVEYNAVGKINADRGSIRFKYTPNYTGNPANEVRLFRYRDNNAVARNELYVYHDTNSAFRVSSRTDAGATIQGGNPFGSKSLVAGTTYDITYSWDFTNGIHRLFIDGVQQGADQTQTGTRSNDTTTVTHLTIGEPYYSNGEYNDVLIYDSFYYASAPSIPYVLPLYRFVDSYTESPVATANASPDGTLLSVESWESIGLNEQYTFNDLAGNAYWFNHVSMAWELSNKTYAQSSTAQQILDHLPSFPFPPNTTQWKYGILFPDYNATTPSYIDRLTVEYTHQIYSLDIPTISPCNTCKIWVEDFFSSAFTEEKEGTDEIKYIMVVDGSKMYHDGASWIASNGTYAQTNTAAEVSTNISELISTRKQVGFEAHLYTEIGYTTPSLDAVSFSYDAALPDPDGLNLVDLNGYIYDSNSPVEGVKVEARPYRNGFNNPADGSGGVFNLYQYKEVGTTLSDGYFSGGIYLQPTGQFWELKIGKQSYRTQLIDKDSNDLNELTMTLVED
jgi:hypothetical protein